MALKDELRNLEVIASLLEWARRCIAQGDVFQAQHILDTARIYTNEVASEIAKVDGNLIERPSRGDRRSGEDRRRYPRPAQTRRSSNSGGSLRLGNEGEPPKASGD